MTAIQIYSASAGSGKTFTLVRAYLKILFGAARYGNYSEFQRILAVTFTNKATEEMKQRIIGTLKGIVADTEPDMIQALREEMPGHTGFQEQAHQILLRILHDFSHFNIQTIDSFFQEIVRSFARELALPINYEIELNSDVGIEYAVEQMMAEIGYDKTLTDWLEKYAFTRIREEKNWNFHESLKSISNEIFDANIDLDELKHNADNISDIRKSLLLTSQTFQSKVSKVAANILNKIQNSGIPEREFNVHGLRNLNKSMEDCTLLTIPIVKTFRDQLSGEKSFIKASGLKNYKWEAEELSSTEFEQSKADLLQLLTEGIREFVTAREALNNIFAVGVLHKIHENLKRFRTERNLLFISDAAKMIGGFIELGDMPFLFEKLGSRLKYVFIDEFQDTSGLQWNNILPVLQNVLGISTRSTSVLLVGDAKQSIYRWRGGDYELLTEKALQDLQPFDGSYKQLDTNYRSLPAIVEFNNLFFEEAKNLPAVQDNALLAEQLRQSYKSSAQRSRPSDEIGYVELRLLEDGKVEEWKSEARDVLDTQIEEVIQKGYRYHDIAILVRNKSDGIEISKHLQDQGIDVLSQETLLLKHDRDVRLIVAGLQFIHQPEEPLLYVNLLWQYALKHGIKEVSENDIFSDFSERKLLREWLPELHDAHLNWQALPFFQILENISKTLRVDYGNLFTNQFRQLAFDFFKKEACSLSDFIVWWSVQEETASVQLENGTNKIHILTIHKSKGLEFPVVMIPYCQWRINNHLHTDLLWLNHPKIAGDIQLPYRAVGALATSYFEDQYQREKNLGWGDNLNLLYVAFTRAKNALYLNLPNKSSSSLPGDIAILVNRVVRRFGEEQANGYSWGKLPQKSTAEKEDKTTTPQRQQDVIHRPLQEIILSQRFESDKTHIGELVHLALFYYNGKDADIAFNKACGTAEYTDVERKLAGEHFSKLLKHPRYQLWLSEALYSWDEQEIQYNGKTLRPDKILKTQEGYVVLDYKTGEQNSSYSSKILEYVQAVRDIFKNGNVEGYIVYSESGHIEQVH